MYIHILCVYSDAITAVIYNCPDAVIASMECRHTESQWQSTLHTISSESQSTLHTISSECTHLSSLCRLRPNAPTTVFAMQIQACKNCVPCLTISSECTHLSSAD